MPKSKHALIVEDEPFTSTLISDLLTDKGFAVTTAPDVPTAQVSLKEFEPDIAIIDLVLGPGPSGVDLTHYIESQHPKTAILILTAYPAFLSSKKGATPLPEKAQFMKKSSISDARVLLDAIQATLQGGETEQSPDLGRLSQLTPHQITVLRLLAEGYSIREISRKCYVTESATTKIIARIYNQLGLDHDGPINQRTEAIRIYIEENGFPER